MTTRIELIFFEGCPHAELARVNLRAALDRSGVQTAWQEWDQLDPGSPEHVRQYGSPTILVDGRDVAGEEGATAALACRAGGAPSIASIQAALVG